MSASILVQAVEAKTFNSGKSGYICKAPGQNYFVWDNNLARELAAHVGDSVEVEIQVKGDFHSIKSFLGVSDSPQSPVVEKGAAPPAPSSSRGGGERATAKKDPAGLQLSARQTSLNAAVAAGANADSASYNIISTAELFYGYLTQDLENVGAGRQGAAQPAGASTPAPTQTIPFNDEVPF